MYVVFHDIAKTCSNILYILQTVEGEEYDSNIANTIVLTQKYPLLSKHQHSRNSPSMATNFNDDWNINFTVYGHPRNCNCLSCSPNRAWLQSHSNVVEHRHFIRSRVGPIEDLQPGDHEPMQLVNEIIQRLLYPRPWNPRRESAIRQWRIFVDDHAESISRKRFQRVPARLLRELCSILGQIFFLGNLRNVPIRWIQDYQGPQPILGQLVPGPWPAYHIEIVQRYSAPLTLSATLDGQAPFYQLVGTCLHEMIHAFLWLYSCSAVLPGCNTNICHDRRIRTEGLSGHGRAWHFLAKAVEDATTELLDVQMDLGRMEALNNEIARGGNPLTVEERRQLFP